MDRAGLLDAPPPRLAAHRARACAPRPAPRSVWGSRWGREPEPGQPAKGARVPDFSPGRTDFVFASSLSAGLGPRALGAGDGETAAAVSPALLRVAGLRGALGAGHRRPAPASAAQAAPAAAAAATGPARSGGLRGRVRGPGVPGGGRRGRQPRPQARTAGRAPRAQRVRLQVPLLLLPGMEDAAWREPVHCPNL